MMASAEQAEMGGRQRVTREGEAAELARPSPPGGSLGRRPPSSPVMHGRSRSELPPASPKMNAPDRSASTVTINPSSYLQKIQERAASAQGTAFDAAPARSASALGTYSRTSDGTSFDASPPLLGLSRNGSLRSSQSHSQSQSGRSQASALLRARLQQAQGGGSSQGSSPEANSSLGGSTPSPVFSVRSTSGSSVNEPSPAHAHEVGNRSAELDARRALRVEEAKAQLAEQGRARPASPGMMPYAARSQPRLSPVLSPAPLPSAASMDETMMAAAPVPAPSVYRDAPAATEPAPMHRPNGVRRQDSFGEPHGAPYQDENAFAAPPARAPLQAKPRDRVVLAESYRSNNPPVPAPQPTPQQDYAKANEHYAPLRDRSPGMAEATPSFTHQQHHYNQQQQQQQLHQQQQYQLQQQAIYQQNGHPSQPPYSNMMYAQPEPVAQPKPKKGQSVIIVNGKIYARAGLLGKGGSSRVYRVLDASNHLYAIKRVDISKNDAESRASFINEIHLLNKLKGNPQIINLVDSEINDQKKQLMMVMEVGEIDLNGLLIEHSGKPISMNFIRYIWEQMLRAVKVIHEENVVHTDLKPANFVLVKGQLKLIDFGISKAIGNDTTNIGRDQQIGTANYMPPEALIDSGMGANGKRLMKLGRAADVWSLGCILHQMVYGRTPFSHLRDVGQKIMAIQNPRHVISFPEVATVTNMQGVELAEMRVLLGPDLLDAMRTCLVWDPKQRATIPELLEAPFLCGAEGGPQTATPARSGAWPASGLPTVDEATMQAIVQRIGAAVGGGDLRQADVERMASVSWLLRGHHSDTERVLTCYFVWCAQKLMRELRASA